jgi:hypothetical protein
VNAAELLPDSALSMAAIAHARQTCAPWLFHHVMRSACHAELIGRRRKLAYDRELLCVAAVLHDLGLAPGVPVQERFEVEGADAACSFLEAQGMARARLATVWDAIALHTTTGIAQRKGPEVALCQLGIASDLGLVQPALLSSKDVDMAIETYPWEELHRALPDTLVGLYRQNATAAGSNAVADACEHLLPEFVRFNFCRQLAEQPGHSLHQPA